MNALLTPSSRFEMFNSCSSTDFSESKEITAQATSYNESIVRSSPELAPRSAANEHLFRDENGTPLSEAVMASFSPPFKRSVAASSERS